MKMPFVITHGSSQTVEYLQFVIRQVFLAIYIFVDTEAAGRLKVPHLYTAVTCVYTSILILCIYLYCPNLVQWSRFHTSKAVLLAQPFIKVWTYFSNRRLAFAVWLVWEDKCKHAGAFYFLVHNHHGMSMILRLFLLPSRSLVQWTWEVCQFENYVFRSIRPGSIDVLHMRQTGMKI